MANPKGNHVIIDEEKPEPIGFCDYSGFPYLRKDLVKDLQYDGSGALRWTGLMVGKDRKDTPNRSIINPILPPDPEPVKYAKPGQYAGIYSNIVLNNPANGEAALTKDAHFNVKPFGE